MRGYRGASGLAAGVALSLVASFPLLTGQGCPGGSNVIPVKGGMGGDNQVGVGGNAAPTFRFTAPMGPVQAEIGDRVYVSWTCNDPDDNARITILLDPDTNPTNGNEIPVAVGLYEDDPLNSFVIDTGSYGLTTGSYRIIARVTDGVNPELLVAATGQLNLFAPGMSPGNVSPTVVVTNPVRTLSVSEGSEVQITYCGNDRDDGEGGVIADVLVMLDYDSDPLNDLFAQHDHRTPESAAAIAEMCAGDLPLYIGGAVLLECRKDDKCTDPTQGTDVNVTIDATRIPQPPGGEPYRVRVTMWDHTNPPVHAYASGTLSISALASGRVDLGKVGKSISGARFLGFDEGARCGFTGTSLGDFDDDGADDFILVSRFGRPLERGNVGSAHLIYGLPGERFGGDISVNGWGNQYRGCEFAMGRGIGGLYAQIFMNAFDPDDPTTWYDLPYITPVTDGITSVSTVRDLDGDGRPEILFGTPYVELLYDYVNDDPENCEGVCYNDGYPNPLATGAASMTSLDNWFREDPFCTNDGDLTRATGINQGYAFYVRSDNPPVGPIENVMIDLTIVGQHLPPPASIQTEELLVFGAVNAPRGARFRGGYYFYDLDVIRPGFRPHSQFGATVSSLPDLSDGNQHPRRDNRDELLISAPREQNDRGMITMVFGAEYSTFNGDPNLVSLPAFSGCRGRVFPVDRRIHGKAPGDQLGYASSAGDFNLDGHVDILAGAPGASRNGIDNIGIVYVIFGRVSFGTTDLSKHNPPRMEIHGTNQNDHFGKIQTLIGDVNNDGYQDVAFASELADGPAGMDAGMVGIMFGGRPLTGENIFTVTQVGTPQLPGCVFYGSQRGGRAGASIANIGDFNGDGFDDLLIAAPHEVHMVDGQNRRGAAYLIFGGPHLANNPVRNFFMLDQVGTEELPGIVFISPYTQGTADEAPIDWVGGAGDVDGDGFRDILLGVSTADFVNPLEPSQRRIDAGEAYLIYGNNSGGNVVRW
jgi:hypothetical protein